MRVYSLFLSKIFFSIAVACVTSFGAQQEHIDCASATAKIALTQSAPKHKVDVDKGRFHYSIDGLPITGGDHSEYLVPKIMSGLGITDTDIHALAGKSLLSIGEGYSGFLDHVNAEGKKLSQPISAKAMDLSS